MANFLEKMTQSKKIRGPSGAEGYYGRDPGLGKARADAAFKQGNEAYYQSRESRRDQTQATAMARDAALGKTPSQAELAMRRGVEQAQAQSIGLARSGRGPTQGAAMRAAVQANAGMSTQAAAQAAELRAAEMAAARQAYAQQVAAQRGMDLAAAGAMYGREQSIYGGELQARTNLLGQRWQADAAREQADAARDAGIVNLAGTAAGILGMAFSDAKAKTNTAGASTQGLGTALAMLGKSTPKKKIEQKEFELQMADDADDADDDDWGTKFAKIGQALRGGGGAAQFSDEKAKRPLTDAERRRMGAELDAELARRRPHVAAYDDAPGYRYDTPRTVPTAAYDDAPAMDPEERRRQLRELDAAAAQVLADMQRPAPAAREAVARTKPVAFRYRPEVEGAPGAPPGPHVGILAQDLERSPAGRTVVRRDPATGLRQVDVGGLAALLTAHQGDQERRLRKLERGRR